MKSVAARIKNMKDGGNCIMTKEKQELVGWWRMNKKNEVCVSDRSLGYAFFLITAIFPFGIQYQMPSLAAFMTELEKASFFKDLTKQFGYVMMLAYASVTNLPVSTIAF